MKKTLEKGWWYPAVPYVVAFILFLWSAYFPNTFISTTQDSKQLNLLFYIVAPVLFVSTFLVIFRELGRLDFVKYKLGRATFSLLFGCSAIYIMTETLLGTPFCVSFGESEILPKIRIYSFAVAIAFVFISVFGLLAMEILKRRRIDDRKIRL